MFFKEIKEVSELKGNLKKIRGNEIMESCLSWTKHFYRKMNNNGDYLYELMYCIHFIFLSILLMFKAKVGFLLTKCSYVSIYISQFILVHPLYFFETPA